MAAPGGDTSQNTSKKVTFSGRDIDLAPQDPVITQHDLLITEIESADGHLGTTLRTIYDGDNDQSLGTFMERLDVRIKSHDKEIERMCNHHYEGFITSIQSLLQVRSDAAKLQEKIQYTNDELQNSGRSLIDKAEELVKCRKTQNNISASIETLSLCLPVLETYGKLRDQMKNKRYYPALKTLEQLEHTYLPRVSKYRFSQVMCETIPKLRESIKEASMSDLKDFLENIRKHSERIGEVAMKHAAEQNNMDPSLATKRGKKRKAPPPPNPFTGEIEAEEEDANPFGDDVELDEGLSAQDLIDFSPVYRCLHINSVLGARETFESYYRKQRRKQARLALQPPPNMSRPNDNVVIQDKAKRLVHSRGYDPAPHETLDGYKKYFHEIVGFFVVEDHILSTTIGLVNRAYIDELWDMALSKIVAVLRTHSGFCTDPNSMLQIKALIMLFCHTLKGYGFTVSQLYDLLLEIRDQYGEILMKRWVQVFNEIFDKDNYTPICVQTQEEYDKIVKQYPFRDEQLEEGDFPKFFPFSQFVPSIYIQVKEYIYACLKFSEDLNLSHTEIDDMVRKLANVLLTRSLGGSLSGLIKKPKLALLQLIQIAINMNYLEKSCIYLEEFISNITGAEKDSVHVSRLQGTTMFKDARNEAEDQIYTRINDKIDEFFELASYDWMAVEPLDEASGHMTDIITFLQTTFLAFTNLPEKVAQTACMSACKHIADVMMKSLTDNDVKFISHPAIQQFNKDLLECENFANSNPVSGLNDGTLKMAFVDLRQLIDLFLAWDWSTYIADYGKPKARYLRVKPNTAIILLEKMKDADKRKNNLFSSLKKNERDKKRLVDTVLKQLRQLVVNGHTQH